MNTSTQPFSPSHHLLSRLWYWLIKNSCGLILRLFFGFRVRGRKRVPAGGATLLLSNHASHLDPVLVGVASQRQLRFLARDSLFFWPLGWLISSLGAVPIHRESGVAGLRTTLRILKQQEALLLFPEGTRSHDGRLQPLKAGFCAVARRSQAALVPVGIAGSFNVLPRGRAMPRLKRILLEFGEPIPYADYAELDDEGLVQLVSQRLSMALDAAAEAPETAFRQRERPRNGS